ncbi:MAG: hypothetical protein AB8G15_14485 [Saprospiraceae bacterium]
MKLLFQTLVTLCLITLFSCQSEEQKTITLEVDSHASFESFKEDQRVQSLVQALFTLKNLPPETIDKIRFYTLLQDFNKLGNNLLSDYGRKHITDFLSILVEREAQLNSRFPCCELNTGGTVDWSCCGFWESAVVAVDVYFGCSQPTAPLAEGEALAYYHCIQESVCANC